MMKITQAIIRQKTEQVKKTSTEKSILERDIQLFPHRISDKDKELIYRQLNVLQNSGVDILTSFEILFKQIKNKKTKEKLKGVMSLLVKGKSLSSAMEQYSDFSPYEVFSLKIGEETGRLNLVLEKLTLYFENKIAQRRQVSSALSYPILIVLTSLGAVTFMIFFIIPMFEEVFVRFNNDLPGLTKWVIGVSHAFKSNGIYILSAFLLLFLLSYLLKSNYKYRYGKEWLFLKVPVIGEIYQHVYLARFCDSMSLLISASVPMMHALDMVKRMIGFIHIERVVDDIKTDLMHGKSLTHAMERHEIYDDQLIALVKVGEEVNQLGSFFQKLADDYTASIKHKTSLLSTFLEPLMIVFLGMVVGLILVAMYLPMFELSSSMDFGN